MNIVVTICAFYLKTIYIMQLRRVEESWVEGRAHAATGGLAGHGGEGLG